MRVPLLEETIATAVRVGGLAIPARQLESHLGKYSVNLVVWNHDETYKVSLVGSATPLLYRGKYLLLCSGHQLSQVNIEDVSVIIADGRLAVTSNGFRGYRSSEIMRESDAFDIAAFDFSDACKVHREIARSFFDFNLLPADTLTDKIVAFVACGYPSADQIYDLEENNHFGSVKRIITCLPDGQPYDRSLLRIRTAIPMDFNPDGLSGGPVYVVQLVDIQPVAFFAGIMLRAGGNTIHLLKCGYIKSFLDAFIDGDNA